MQNQLKAKKWFEGNFKSGNSSLPFSFKYDGDGSSSFLTDWKSEWKSDELLVLTDPRTGLECSCEVTAFDDFPAVEWVLYFKNTGTAPTPIIEDILPVDTAFAMNKDIPARVHHAKGSDCKIDDFMPLETLMGTDNSKLHLEPQFSRSSDGTMPFFNIDMTGEGVIGAIGWTGAWKADITRDEEAFHLSAGMKKTHLKLLPGEEMRTPRILLIFWEGDWIDGQNTSAGSFWLIIRLTMTAKCCRRRLLKSHGVKFMITSKFSKRAGG